jgi:hypothetical protein
MERREASVLPLKRAHASGVECKERLSALHPLIGLRGHLLIPRVRMHREHEYGCLKS